MKIMMLVASPKVKGPIPKITSILVGALQNLGCQVDTEVWSRQSNNESLLTKLLERPAALLKINRTLQRQTYDLMLVHTTLLNWKSLLRDIPLMILNRRWCPHNVIMFHGSKTDRLVVPGNHLFKMATALLIKFSEAILVLSTEEQRQLEQFYPGGKYFTVSNPFVSSHDSKDGELSQMMKYQKQRKEPTLLFVGRLMEAKGIFDLINALPTVLEKFPCHLVIAGEGIHQREVLELIDRYNLEDRVTLTGHIEPVELNKLYRKADIFVLPSWSEGFPTVITEAMDAGLPIVTTSIRGMLDHLEEEVNALFVPPRQPKQIARAIIRLLDDDALRSKMSQSNLEKVKEFAPHLVGQHYVELFQKLCSV